MKKTLIALAVLAVSGAAFAQSTATISGSISVGVMDTGLAGAKMGVASLGGGANAINIVTAEDLGGGMRAGFDSQMRFSSATGDRNSAGTGNALFHGANAYMSGGMGTIRVGKIIEANNCAFDPWACTGGAGTNAGAPGTISGLIAAGTTTADITAFTASVPMGAYTLLASSAKNKKAATTADTKTAVGINYALSKRTTVGADMFKQDAVGSSTGFVARVRHNF